MTRRLVPLCLAALSSAGLCLLTPAPLAAAAPPFTAAAPPFASADVLATNGTPSAAPVSGTTPQETATQLTLLGSDPDGDALTYSVWTPPHGGVTGDGPVITYLPDVNFVGTDTFTYTVSDGTSTSLPATVTVVVTPVVPVCSSPTVLWHRSWNVVGATTLSATVPGVPADTLLVAFVVLDGPAGTPKWERQGLLQVSGGGLSWAQTGGGIGGPTGVIEVWSAWADAAVGPLTLSATSRYPGYDGSVTLAAFADAASSLLGMGSGGAIGAGGTPTVQITPEDCGSLLVAAGLNQSSPVVPAPLSGQQRVSVFWDLHSWNGFWVQVATAPSKAGVSVLMGARTPVRAGDTWTLLALEIPGRVGR